MIQLVKTSFFSWLVIFSKISDQIYEIVTKHQKK